MEDRKGIHHLGDSMRATNRLGVGFRLLGMYEFLDVKYIHVCLFMIYKLHILTSVLLHTSLGCNT